MMCSSAHNSSSAGLVLRRKGLGGSTQRSRVPFVSTTVHVAAADTGSSLLDQQQLVEPEEGHVPAAPQQPSPEMYSRFSHLRLSDELMCALDALNIKEPTEIQVH